MAEFGSPYRDVSPGHEDPASLRPDSLADWFIGCGLEAAVTDAPGGMEAEIAFQVLLAVDGGASDDDVVAAERLAYERMAGSQTAESEVEGMPTNTNERDDSFMQDRGQRFAVDVGQEVIGIDSSYDGLDGTQDVFSLAREIDYVAGHNFLPSQRSVIAFLAANRATERVDEAWGSELEL